jgi:hypothetical protein
MEGNRTPRPEHNRGALRTSIRFAVYWTDLTMRYRGGTMRAQRRAAFLTLVIGPVVTVLAACGAPGTSGSGPTTSELRNVEAFSRVEVANGIGLTIHVGGAQTVEVSAPENILPLIATTVEAGILKIHGTESFTTTSEVAVAISVSTLDGISAAGGSQAEVKDLASDHFDIVLSEGAGLTATGRATDVTLDASGGASADLATLTVETMGLELSGGATAALNVSDQLTGSASGGAVATVAGGAALDVQTSGGASVTSN